MRKTIVYCFEERFIAKRNTILFYQCTTPILWDMETAIKCFQDVHVQICSHVAAIRKSNSKYIATPIWV